MIGIVGYICFIYCTCPKVEAGNITSLAFLAEGPDIQPGDGKTAERKCLEWKLNNGHDTFCPNTVYYQQYCGQQAEAPQAPTMFKVTN